MATPDEVRQQALMLCSKNNYATLKSIFSVFSFYSEQSDEFLDSWYDEIEFLAKILLAFIDIMKSRRSHQRILEGYERESGVLDSLDKGGHTGYAPNSYSPGRSLKEIERSEAQLEELCRNFGKVLKARLARGNEEIKDILRPV